MTKTTEERDELRERNKRRKNCGNCGGNCALLVGLDDAGHFPGVTYKRCTACGWEIALRGRRAK